MDTTTALGGTSACSLLSPDDLAIVPGLRDPIAGFGDWECSWSDRAAAPTDVVLRFYRGHPLRESDGTPADFAGHPSTVLAGEGHCRVHFVQHDYTAEETPRTEEVWVTVYRQEPGSALCGTATTLATAAAGRLPPPS
jgi:hypothetical protein